MDISRKTAASNVIFQPSEGQSDVPMCLTQNAVLQITLTGPALVATILTIIAAIQFFNASLTCSLIALAPIPLIIYHDYENFLLLGPGGTPSTFLGYLKIAYLRLYALRDPYTVVPPTEPLNPSVGCYKHIPSWLPQRAGPRPLIAGIAPQRQIDQPGSGKAYRALQKSLENLGMMHDETLCIGTSCFEKKGLALFARNPINATCRGEICHVHHSDRSLHMNLHPDDARVVLEMGWGERHPLSKGGWMQKYVPREFVMIYAPRDEMELDVVCRIIEAAAFWVTGQRYELKVEKDMVLQQENMKLIQ